MKEKVPVNCSHGKYEEVYIDYTPVVSNTQNKNNVTKIVSASLNKEAAFDSNSSLRRLYFKNSLILHNNQLQRTCILLLYFSSPHSPF